MKHLLVISIIIVSLLFVSGCSDTYIIKKNNLNSSGNTTEQIQTAVNISSYYQILTNWDNVLDKPLIINGTDGVNGSGTSSLPLNGILNDTFSADVLENENYFNNPMIGWGCYENWLLQTEAFGTTWVHQFGGVITNNNAVSPIGTVIAENILGNSSSGTNRTNVYQTITNSTKENYTFSIWARTYLNNVPNATIHLWLHSNNDTLYPQTIYNISLTQYWNRYNITVEYNFSHTIKNVSIIQDEVNISLWGAQLERGKRATINGAPRTTTGNYVQTCGGYTRNAWIFQSGITSSGAGTFVGVSAGGALTATTGGFSSTVTSTLAPAFVSTDGLVSTSTTASTLASPIQLSPRLRLSGTVWDLGAGASRTVNFKQEVIPMSGKNGTAKMVWGYGYNTVADIDINQLMILSSSGSLDIFGNNLSNQVLNNGNFSLGNTSWTMNGGWRNVTGSMLFYNSASGLNGNLTQNISSLNTTLKPNRWYKLSYNISGTGVLGCVAYVGNTTGVADTYLAGVSVVTAGQLYDINFKTNNNPTDFMLTARCTAGSFYLDSLLLREFTSGDIIANGRLTGGGTEGLAIDNYGNVTITNLSGTGNAVLCLNSAGTIYRGNTTGCP